MERITGGCEMTGETITDEQISALRDEAAVAGDLEQVAVCDAALRGDASARRECALGIEWVRAEVAWDATLMMDYSH